MTEPVVPQRYIALPGSPGYQCQKKLLFLATNDTKSAVLNIRGFTRGAIYLPAEFNTDVITFEGSDRDDGTFAVILSSAAAATGFTAAAAPAWYDLHTSLFGVGFLKIVTGTAVAAPATVLVSLRVG